ncbi:MAG: 30S ribosomal protein S6 [Patescibacteria group bacterium]|nr:30S ribosomal protein S6 [Patescibacteria group bacterium]
MDKTDREDRIEVYEIGYLIAGVPEERVSAEADALKGVATSEGAVIIAEEAPRRERLAYTIRKKAFSGAYDKHDFAYFGWVKLEAASDKIEGIKKRVEALPSVLRMLLISTVRENTYLGKRAPAAPGGAVPARSASPEGDKAKEGGEAPAKPAAPASVEDMDKSIDEMVKEV